jgi:DNA-binding MurR/RpiR family transcriptional regulator
MQASFKEVIMVFSYEKVQSLNPLELCVYKYVTVHLEECKTMTIRDLSEQCHVSSTTILRFLKKMGFEGFADFKYILRHHDQQVNLNDMSQEFGPISKFLNSASSTEYAEKVEAAAQMIVDADTRLFFGMGSSGNLAQYGARVLSNYGMLTLAIADPFQPQPISNRDYSETLIILLSVSGETEGVITQANYYRQNGAKTLAITAKKDSTLAQMVDFSLVYDIPEKKLGSVNFTSQIPVVYLLEQLGEQTSKMVQNEVPERNSNRVSSRR